MDDYELQTYHRNNFYQNTKHFSEDWLPKGNLSKEELEVKYSKYDKLLTSDFALDSEKCLQMAQKLQTQVFTTIEQHIKDYFIFKYDVLPTKENFIELGFSWSQFHRVLQDECERFYDGEELILSYNIRNYTYYRAWEDQ